MRKKLNENSEFCVRINGTNIYKHDPNADLNALADLFTEKGAQISNDTNYKQDVIMVVCGLPIDEVYEILDNFLIDGFDKEFDKDFIDSVEGTSDNNYDDVEDFDIPAYEDVDINECGEINEEKYSEALDEAKDEFRDALLRIVDEIEFDPAIVLDSVIDDGQVKVFSIDEKGYANTNVGLIDILMDIEDADDIYTIVDIIKDSTPDFSNYDEDDDVEPTFAKMTRRHHLEEKKKGCCPKHRKFGKVFESLKAQDSKDQDKVDKSEKIIKMVLDDIESNTYGEHEAMEALKKLKAENNKLRKIKGTNGKMLCIADIKGTKKALKALANITSKTNKEVTKFEASLNVKVQECLNNNKKCLHENVRINGKSLKEYSAVELKNIYKKVYESKKLLTLKLKNNLNESNSANNIKEMLNKKNQLLEYLDEEITYRTIRAKFLNEDNDSDNDSDNTISDEELQNMFGGTGQDNNDNNEESDEKNDEESEETEEVELAKIVITLKDADALEALKQACLDADIPEDAFEIEGVEDEESEENSEDNSEENSEDEDKEKTDEDSEKNEAYQYENIMKLLFEDENSDNDSNDDSNDDSEDNSDENSDDDSKDDSEDESAIKFILINTDYAETLADVLDKRYGISKEEFEEMIGGEIMHEDDDSDNSESDKDQKDDKESKDDNKDEKDEIDPSDLFKGL